MVDATAKIYTHDSGNNQGTQLDEFVCQLDNGRITQSPAEYLMRGIDGKVVAITGASSGIGEATAKLLAGYGAEVVLGARRSDRLEALTARIAQSGGEAAFIRTDVKRREDLSRRRGDRASDGSRTLMM